MSANDELALISKYSARGLLIDANLLLLYCVGEFDPRLISTFKRTRSQGFTADDYQLLKRLIGLFTRIVTTPNILTEVSNLSKFDGRIRDAYFRQFGTKIAEFDERFFMSKQVCANESFFTFGLTDAAIAQAANDHLVLTVDFPLSNYLKKNKIDVINFNHLRQIEWGHSRYF